MVPAGGATLVLDNSAAAPGTPLAQVIPEPPQRPGGDTVGLAAVGAECWGVGRSAAGSRSRARTTSRASTAASPTRSEPTACLLRFPDRKAAERMRAWVQVLPGFFDAGVTAEQRRSRAALGQQRRAPPHRPAPAEHSVLSRCRHRSGNVARRVVQLCVLGGRAVYGRRARAHLLPEAPARSVRPSTLGWGGATRTLRATRS